MKQPLLGAMAFLTFGASGLPAYATPIDFTYTGNLVTFTVLTTDTYQILAFGAQGGNGLPFPSDGTVSIGGHGAEIGGYFTLIAGEILEIAVGGMGTGGPGGGGGSFVVGPGNTPLVIAGGGGGGGFNGAPGFPGQGGLTGPDGGGPGGGTGGNGGAGSKFLDSGASGGGGFFSAGGGPIAGPSTGGGAFPDLTGGIFGGGFGGGGGRAKGGGGGGGYSGGGGADCGQLQCGGAGGGGSWDAGIDQILVADFRTGNGEVIITEIAAAIPEPSSVALVGVGLLSLAAVWRRRGRLSHPR